MTIILGVLPFIWVNDTHFLDTLGLFIPMAVYTLTDSVMSPEFNMDYPNLAHIDIFLIHLGTSRIIIGIIFTKN